VIQDKLNEMVKGIKEQQEKHSIERTFVLYSGGNDSGALVAAVMDNGLAEAVIHIDTGIGIPQTQQHVIDVCDSRGYPLHIAPAPFDFEDMVMGRVNGIPAGFPSPKIHYLYYTRLKERALTKFRRENKTRRGEKWLLLTGIRQQESIKRMRLTSPESKMAGFYWFNPAFKWSKKDCRDAMKHYNVPENEVSLLLGYSGECLCGANAQKGELEMIERFYPDCGRRLRDLEEKAKEAGYWWGWDERAPKGYSKNQTVMSFMADESQFSLCTNCMVKNDDE
jgi:3'-phosphoadenosine 5'-phosphosulfate sulfotransferase (PAPS reductase)/FAD synthetase